MWTKLSNSNPYKIKKSLCVHKNSWNNQLNLHSTVLERFQVEKKEGTSWPDGLMVTAQNPRLSSSPCPVRIIAGRYTRGRKRRKRCDQMVRERVTAQTHVFDAPFCPAGITGPLYPCPIIVRTSRCIHYHAGQCIQYGKRPSQRWNYSSMPPIMQAECIYVPTQNWVKFTCVSRPCSSM